MFLRALGPRLAMIVLAGLSIMMGAAASTAATGSTGLRPDRSFGGGRGFVTTPIRGTASLAYGAVVTPGGGIVLAGQASPPNGNGQVIVARYLPGGGLDRSFGTRGIFTSAFPTADAPFIATAIARDPRTGAFVIGGGYGEGSMLVMRLTAKGRLDHSFGTHRRGFTQIAIGGTANSLAIQRDGRILLGGSNANLNGRPFVVARFTRSGSLDRTFGQRGIAQSLFWDPNAASSAGVNTLVPTSDGGVIAGGHIDYIGGTGGGSAGHGAAGVFRLTRGGRPSRRFGTSGHTQITFFSGSVPQSWYPCRMVLDGKNRITVTGGGGTQRSALFTARLTSAGALDRTYGRSRNGRSATPGLGGNAITTCGMSGTPAGTVTVGLQNKLVQLLPSGQPNKRFAPRTVFTITRPPQVYINALLSNGSGRLLAVGSSGNSLYLARYLVAPQP